MPFRLVPAFPLFIALAAISAPHATLIARPSAQTIAGAWVLNPALTQRPEEIGFTPEWARAQGSGGTRRGGPGSGGGAMGVPASSRERERQHARGAAHRRCADTALTTHHHPEGHRHRDRGRSGARAHLPSRRASRVTDDRHRATAHYGTVGWAQPRRGLRRRDRPAATLHVHVVGRSHAVASEHSVPRAGREGDEVRLTYEPAGAHERGIVSGVPGGARRAVSVSIAAAWRTGGRGAICASSAAAARIRAARSDHDRHGRRGSERGRQGVRARSGEDQNFDRAHPGGCRFKTERFGNEETYLFLSVVTSRLPDGLCVSRYDASLVTRQRDVSVPEGSVAVPVQLLHEGGLARGSPASHASAVMDALVKSASRFVSQIRAAGVAPI